MEAARLKAVGCKSCLAQANLCLRASGFGHPVRNPKYLVYCNKVLLFGLLHSAHVDFNLEGKTRLKAYLSSILGN